jgi:hypothetical protein
MRRKFPSNRKRRRSTLRQTLAVAAGIVAFGIVFRYSGDADLFYLIGSGLGAGAAFYLLSGLVTAFRQSTG